MSRHILQPRLRFCAFFIADCGFWPIFHGFAAFENHITGSHKMLALRTFSPHKSLKPKPYSNTTFPGKHLKHLPGVKWGWPPSDTQHSLLKRESTKIRLISKQLSVRCLFDSSQSSATSQPDTMKITEESRHHGVGAVEGRVCDFSHFC